MNSIPTLLKQILSETRSVEHARRQAEEIQWSASPASKREALRGGKGLANDPTATIATDPKRLEVRAAIRDAERDLVKARNHLSAARARLEKAYNRWSD